MKPGDITPVIPSTPKFLVVKLVDRRTPDDPAIEARAREVVLVNAQNKVLTKEKTILYGKYLKQNKKLIRSIDFDAKKPGIDKLLKDKRVLVSVKGGKDKPITVADLAEALTAGFTHGIQRAIQEKRANAQKAPALDDLMSRIVINKEALARGLDKSADYREKIAKDEEMTLFGVFIEKALKPEVKIGEKDLKDYYEAHLKEFSYPEMVKLKSIVFKKRESAQKALEKLRQGMDLKWLTANAEDRVDPASAGIQNFNDQLVTTTSLPEGAQKALAGAKSEEYRLYESPDGYYYVLFVEKMIPARQQTLEEAAKEIVPATYQLKLKSVMQDWTKKLRDAADVKIYADFTN
jgi:PPIC-type PPIASE domain